PCSTPAATLQNIGAAPHAKAAVRYEDKDIPGARASRDYGQAVVGHRGEAVRLQRRSIAPGASRTAQETSGHQTLHNSDYPCRFDTSASPRRAARTAALGSATSYGATCV